MCKRDCRLSDGLPCTCTAAACTAAHPRATDTTAHLSQKLVGPHDCFSLVKPNQIKNKEPSLSLEDRAMPQLFGSWIFDEVASAMIAGHLDVSYIVINPCIVLELNVYL